MTLWSGQPVKALAQFQKLLEADFERPALWAGFVDAAAAAPAGQMTAEQVGLALRLADRPAPPSPPSRPAAGGNGRGARPGHANLHDYSGAGTGVRGKNGRPDRSRVVSWRRAAIPAHLSARAVSVLSTGSNRTYQPTHPSENPYFAFDGTAAAFYRQKQRRSVQFP